MNFKCPTWESNLRSHVLQPNALPFDQLSSLSSNFARISHAPKLSRVRHLTMSQSHEISSKQKSANVIKRAFMIISREISRPSWADCSRDARTCKKRQIHVYPNMARLVSSFRINFRWVLANNDIFDKQVGSEPTVFFWFRFQESWLYSAIPDGISMWREKLHKAKWIVTHR